MRFNFFPSDIYLVGTYRPNESTAKLSIPPTIRSFTEILRSPIFKLLFMLFFYISILLYIWMQNMLIRIRNGKNRTMYK